MLALVRCRGVENLDANECGVVGVFIAPTTIKWPLELGRLQSHGTPDSPVRHQTLSSAPATSADRWGSTVGTLSYGPAWLSDGAPDKSCRLSGAPSRACLTPARSGAH
jgi:hypothetical protein